MKKVSFSIDRGADQPIYQQIVDQITQMVNDGLLSPGDQLPTGSELLEKYGIARGTVQYAYNKLSENGVISVVQGKGSFIRGKEPTAHTVNTIDYYLDELSKLVSLDELELLLGRKIHDRMKRQHTIKISILENCLELRENLTQALSSFPDSVVSSHSVQELFDNPSVFYDYDLIVSSEFNILSISKESFYPNIKDNLIPISIEMDFESLKNLASLSPSSSIGIFCQTKQYFEINRWELISLDRALTLHDYFLASSSYWELAQYLANKSVLLTAQSTQQYASSGQLQILSDFKARGGQIVPLKYTPDTGSMLHIDEYIHHFRISHSRILR